MLYPRIIPCLLLHNNGLVKTKKFKNPKYIGDPINAVKIFNEKEVDELIVLDIDATPMNREPDYKLIQNLASQCRMPLCYGGGVKTMAQAKKILSLGVEKIAVSSAVSNNLNLISEISKEIGSQSLAIILDVKKKFFKGYQVKFKNNENEYNLLEIIKKIESLGAGEIIINSIDNDGMMKGYDLNLACEVKNKLNIPMTILGGAGSLKDISKVIEKFKIIGCGVGSLFIFKGKYKAVLINYPNKENKKKIINNLL